jgi:hypothetical protein
MTKLIKEDWERVHLTDEMYIGELEMQEKEHFRKPPAKIILNIEKPKKVKK